MRASSGQLNISQGSSIGRAVIVLLCVTVAAACDGGSSKPPTAATPIAVAPPVSQPTPPPPARTFVISGLVTVGGSGFGSGFAVGQAAIRALDDANAGRSAQTSTTGGYSIREVNAGQVTLAASAPGYRTLEKTVAVDSDTRIDFVLPRVSMSPVPPLAGTWGARMEWNQGGGRAWLAEFKLVQTGSVVSGTWWVPVSEFDGTITGTIDSERNFKGRMTAMRPCAASADLRWGLLDFGEQELTVSVTFGASCLPYDYTFILDRRCRVTSIPTLTCG